MKKRTLLIVDDQVINIENLKNILMDEYSIVEATDGMQALGLLKQNSSKISAVVLDVDMPVMDGYTILKIISNDLELLKIPVIVSSDKGNEDVEVKALSLGAQDFIPKPYNPEIIRHRIKNIIHLRETASIINYMERDELTGLYNKQSFIRETENWLVKNPEQKYDLFCIGIERFQLIVDTFGQSKTDELLRYMADKLSHTGREPQLYGYFQASKFYVLLSHRDIYNSETFALWQREVNEFHIDMNITLYAGIYVINDKTIPVSSMCNYAELAAERNSGNYNQYYSYYDDSIRKELLEEQFIIGNMQQALDKKQFKVYYQPKYNLINEYIVGAEALVRWNHPEKGFMSPGSFIPLFEKNGFITKLDRYVWETVCSDMKEWADSGLPPVAVSVNVSRADIYDSKFSDTLLEMLAKYEIPIRNFHLEITESAYTKDPDQIISSVNKLRSFGFIVEMDDFGSGYSSLNMLAEMPVDVMKLDMRFIQHETTKTSGKGILSFVISLAKWMDLAVVAEGVETVEQIATLRSIDCNYAQGFYFAKPMENRDFCKLLKSDHISEMYCKNQLASHFLTKNTNISVYKGDREMLIVDDMDINRTVLAGAFEDEYKLVEKENGSVAWDYIENNYKKIDIILMDLLMPVMDGFELLDKIRSDKRTKDLPVIITSQGDRGSEHHDLDMKANDFIAKPYNIDIIKHRVHNVVNSCKLKQIQRNSPPNTNSSQDSFTDIEKVNVNAQKIVEIMTPYFDLVRLVDAENTLVYNLSGDTECTLHGCYSVWGKATRCNNCISFKALTTHTRQCKLEYSKDGLYFVVSQYVPYNEHGAVIEMVTKLQDKYVDNIFDKDLLYASLDSINKQLIYDELTGIFNRRYIDTHLEGYIGAAKASFYDVGIAMVDINGFKSLNDEYGHLVGENLLRSIARLISKNIRKESGDFVARYNGDELLIFGKDISPQDFQKEIRTIANIINHISVETGKVDTGIAYGCINLSESPASTAMELIEMAYKRRVIEQKS